jgi:pseudouridine synthase
MGKDANPVEGELETIPLQKYLQRRGLGTKRAIRDLILAGRVQVDGSVVTRFAEPLTPQSVVVLDGQSIEESAPRTTYLLHKPKKHLSQLDDEGERLGLGRYVPSDSPIVFPVGRLDFNSEGALLLTNDGLLARRILHPDWALPKRYGIKIRGHLSEDDPGLARCRAGMTVGETTYLPADVEIAVYRTRSTWVHMVIREGKNRQLRRMCAANRHQIVKLRRLAIGPVELGDLKPRCVRKLDPAEEVSLYEALSLPIPADLLGWGQPVPMGGSSNPSPTIDKMLPAADK